MDRMGGRKFILALVAFTDIMTIFFVMAFRGLLDAGDGMQFVNAILLLSGAYLGSNVVSKKVKKPKIKED